MTSRPPNPMPPTLTRQEAHNRARAAMMDIWHDTGSPQMACQEYNRVMREYGHSPSDPECADEE